MFTRPKPSDLPSSESPRDSSPLATAPSVKPQPRPSESLLTPQPVVPPKPPQMAKPVTEPRRPEPVPVAPETKKLIVGRGISLNGRIAACDRLIVEGKVEAALQDCHTIEIAESGTFKGAAEIESAEVSGHYEGSLTVRKNLIIHGTGHVSGTIRYGRLQIEQGGEINGDVKSLGTAAETKPAATPPRPTVSTGAELPLASSTGTG
jgi:cytoskeletal protein CcmA (bactofilin family)